jgi:hypothetical protein
MEGDTRAYAYARAEAHHPGRLANRGSILECAQALEAAAAERPGSPVQGRAVPARLCATSPDDWNRAGWAPYSLKYKRHSSRPQTSTAPRRARLVHHPVRRARSVSGRGGLRQGRRATSGSTPKKEANVMPWWALVLIIIGSLAFGAFIAFCATLLYVGRGFRF